MILNKKKNKVNEKDLVNINRIFNKRKLDIFLKCHQNIHQDRPYPVL